MLCVDFLDGSAFLQRLSAIQAYALSIPYIHDIPIADHDASSPETEPVNPEPSPTGASLKRPLNNTITYTVKQNSSCILQVGQK